VVDVDVVEVEFVLLTDVTDELVEIKGVVVVVVVVVPD
jgi:hypothetical protein